MSQITVVDANIIFSSLITDSAKLRAEFRKKNLVFSSSKTLIVEIFKHFSRIKKATKLSEEDILNVLSFVLNRTDFYDEDAISIGSWVEAFRLCGKTDEKDTPYVALALDRNAKIWTNDGILKTALRKNGFDNFYEP